MFKILVCGDRNWTDYQFIYNELYYIALFEELIDFKDITIINGTARGADSLGYKAGKALGCQSARYPANWAKYGRRAGPIRNRQMLESGRPDLVLVFHDNINSSRGTKNMVTIARNANVPVRVFKHESE